MPLTLTPTRKDKPFLGFLKDASKSKTSASPRPLSRRETHNDVQAPVFRTSRAQTSETVTR